MKAIATVALGLITLPLAAQSAADHVKIQYILDNQVAAWNAGDADGYSRHFAPDGTFTNILGMFFRGQQAFRDKHAEIFRGPYRGTVLRQDTVSLTFVVPNVSILETKCSVARFLNSGPPAGVHTDESGRLWVRLLQVLRKDGDGWSIVAYHNVDVKPLPSGPELR